ncbi:MAG TPA: hypothetical protein VNW54_12000 [Granulicella sp.]|nr:hypothetical protein [Granulicella sp.]
MKKQTVIALRSHMLGIALLLSVVCNAGSAPAQMSSQMPGMGEAHKEAVRSTALAVTVAGKTQTFPAAEIAAMPHETVSVMNAHLKKTESYSGVPLTALLERMGLPFTKANEHTLMHSYWIAEGTDGYQVVLSAYEAIPAVHMDSVLVADASDGKPLEKDGALKLVISGDKRPQRWVQNLKSLTLKTIE